MKFFKNPLVLLFLFASSMFAQSLLANTTGLPERTGPVPRTTNSVPHVQIDVRTNPEHRMALLQQVKKLRGIQVRDTVVSLPGAKGFWLKESVNVARPEVIVGGREFAHIHPDDSLHASLSPELAAEAVAKGWATYHPWSKKRAGWEGFVMIYTPQSKAEREVVYDLILKSFEYVTGTTLY